RTIARNDLDKFPHYAAARRRGAGRSAEAVGSPPVARARRLAHRANLEAVCPDPAWRMPRAEAFSQGVAELLTNASRFPSGDHEGTLIVPCPPYRYAITRVGPP